MTSQSCTALALPDDIAADLFAPIPTSVVGDMLASCASMRRRVTQVASMFSDDGNVDVISYFVKGNADTDRYHSAVTVAGELFRVDGAVAVLNAEHWEKLLEATDILDCMPEARRREWHDQIAKRTTADFTAENVSTTLAHHLAQRPHYLAERVDGLFRALSGTHVTNSPTGFRKRMILAGIFDSFGSTTRAGNINDLRAVIAKFMGRDAPRYNSTTEVLEIARRDHGEWISVDGGALRLRAYKIGTAHIDVHPEIAWRLNAILALLHPNAIASNDRQRPAKRTKDYVLLGRPLPFAVVALISEARKASVHTRPFNGLYTIAFHPHGQDRRVREAAISVLEAIGGVMQPLAVTFDFDPRDVLGEIVASGCIPDQRAHQYYPTPAGLAERVVELAEIGPEHSCLEPSAGQGSIAQHMPRERTLCIEVSELHCTILRARGLEVDCADFLAWERRGALIDRVVMNPPFSDGRWQSHLEHAASLVADGGRLVAILPASARGKDLLPGWSVSWSEQIDNAFAGCSASVAILVADKPCS